MTAVSVFDFFYYFRPIVRIYEVSVVFIAHQNMKQTVVGE